MQGRILFIDDEIGEGIIRADDAARYRFAVGDLLGSAPAVVGAAVDFECAGDRASGLCVIGAPQPGASGPTPAPIASSQIDTEQGREPATAALTLHGARPGVIGAGLMLLGSLLPFITLPGLLGGAGSWGAGEGHHLFGFVIAVWRAIGLISGLVPTGFTLSLRLTALLLLIPMAAAVLLYREYRETASAAQRSITGLLGLFGPLGIPFAALLLALIIGDGTDLLVNLAGANVGNGASALSGVFGTGMMVMMAGGMVLVAASQRWDIWKALAGIAIYLILAPRALDIGLFTGLIYAVGGAVALVAVLRGWNPIRQPISDISDGVRDAITPVVPARRRTRPAPSVEAEPGEAAAVAASPAPSPAPAPTPGSHCVACRMTVPAGMRFCTHCGVAVGMATE